MAVVRLLRVGPAAGSAGAQASAASICRSGCRATGAWIAHRQCNCTPDRSARCADRSAEHCTADCAPYGACWARARASGRSANGSGGRSAEW